MNRKTVALAVALASFALLGMGSPMAPRSLHVSTIGKDTNPGTATAPFKTIQRAVDVAVAGDSIVVHAGTYREVVTFRKSGTLGQRIRLTSAKDGEVVISPTLPAEPCTSASPTRNRAIQILNGTDYIQIRGLTIVGGILVSGTNTDTLDRYITDRTLPGRATYDFAAADRLLPELGVDPADHIGIRNNTIVGRGIITTGARYGRVVDNEVKDIVCGTGAGIWLNRFSDGWIVRGNFVHNVAASPEHYMSEGIRQGSGSSYNLVEKNLVEDLFGGGRGFSTDMYASWNVIRLNTARRAKQGFNEQNGGWGNQWLSNLAEDNREYGFNVDGKDAVLVTPDDGVPAKMVVRCMVARGNGLEDVHLGAVQEADFSTNAFPSAWVSSKLAVYWSAEGNRWEGSSVPPPPNPTQKFCS